MARGLRTRSPQYSHSSANAFLWRRGGIPVSLPTERLSPTARGYISRSCDSNGPWMNAWARSVSSNAAITDRTRCNAHFHHAIASCNSGSRRSVDLAKDRSSARLGAAGRPHYVVQRPFKPASQRAANDGLVSVNVSTPAIGRRQQPLRSSHSDRTLKRPQWVGIGHSSTSKLDPHEACQAPFPPGDPDQR